jgi:hypothetical protein
VAAITQFYTSRFNDIQSVYQNNEGLRVPPVIRSSLKTGVPTVEISTIAVLSRIPFPVPHSSNSHDGRCIVTGSLYVNHELVGFTGIPIFRKEFLPK